MAVPGLAIANLRDVQHEPHVLAQRKSCFGLKVHKTALTVLQRLVLNLPFMTGFHCQAILIMITKSVLGLLRELAAGDAQTPACPEALVSCRPAMKPVTCEQPACAAA
jgi:hypothetical protein